MSKRLQHLQNLKDGYAILGRPVPGHVQDQLLAEIERLTGPVVTVDYPRRVIPTDTGLTCETHASDVDLTFFHVGQLSPFKRYRLELRFFEVDE